MSSVVVVDGLEMSQRTMSCGPCHVFVQTTS